MNHLEDALCVAVLKGILHNIFIVLVELELVKLSYCVFANLFSKCVYQGTCYLKSLIFDLRM